MLYSAEEARKAVEKANSLETQLSEICEKIKEKAEQGRSSCDIFVRNPHPDIITKLERLGFKAVKYFEGIERSAFIINW